MVSVDGSGGVGGPDYSASPTATGVDGSQSSGGVWGSVKGFLGVGSGNDSIKQQQRNMENNQIQQNQNIGWQQHQSQTAAFDLQNQTSASVARNASTGRLETVRADNLTKRTEQQMASRNMQYQDQIMADDSLPMNERIELLGKMTANHRSSDRYQGQLSMSNNEAKTSNGSFQQQGMDSGANSLGQNSLLQGQGQQLSLIHI